MKVTRALSSPLIAEFTDDGRRYIVRDPHFIDRADADLWNDRMYLQIDQRGRCDAWFLQPNQTRYSEPLRAFYLRDDEGDLWSAPFDPVQAEPDEFEFSPGLADVRWRVVRHGIELRLKLVIPREDTVELWSVEVINRRRRAARISLFSLLPVGSVGLLAHQAAFDRDLGGMLHRYFPYYVRWQDYERLSKLKNCVVCVPSRRPTAFECNLNDFRGGRGLHNAAMLERAKLAGGGAMHEPSAGIFQFDRELAPGKTLRVDFLFGPAADREDAARMRDRYLIKGGFERALAHSERFLAEHAPSVRVETPDAELNHYLNHWQPRRALLIGRTMRLTFCPQGRNAIQDAMGAVFTNPDDARQWLLRVFSMQEQSGWMPHGLRMDPQVDMMPIGMIPHRDTVTWGATALHTYVAETGDAAILDEPLPFADDPTPQPLYEHINRSLEWSLADRTERGLSRLGEGDWDDPLNMAGKDGRGESIWLTEALSFALDTWADVAAWRGDAQRAERYRREAAACRQAVNDLAWDGRWYARGTTDAGRWFGTQKDSEGRIFLNSQSWALLCGAAEGERLKRCIESVRKLLMTPPGPMLVTPAFSGMREDIGKLTQKVPGTGENGSVYCHAVTFYAFALFKAGQAEEGFRMLRNLLPGTKENPIERAGQLPLYVPNYFRGTPCGASAGRSSHAANTGTSAWYYRTVITMLLGIRGELGGLRIDPQLPAAWKQARVWRKWRRAEFDITIERRRGAKTISVTLDGQPLADNLIPPQSEGSRHVVQVMLPS